MTTTATPTTATPSPGAEAALPPPVAPACPDSGIPAGSVPSPGPEPQVALRSLSIVLLCRDAEASVADAIRNAAAAAAATSEDYEIVVVDDGSSDATAVIVGRFAEADRRVRLLVHARRRGHADTLRSGIRAARGDWVLLAGADLQYDLRELEDLVPLTEGADVLWGWPILRAGSVAQRAGAAVRNRLTRLLLALPVRDVDCEFRLIRRDILERLELRMGDALIDTELVIRCRAVGARFAEVGVRHRQGAAERSGRMTAQL